MLPGGLPNLINPMMTPGGDKARSNSLTQSMMGKSSINESQEQIQKIMLKRLNYIQYTLDGYDPVK